MWLSDEKSHSPIDPNLIPNHISDLINDPFRSLALVTRNYRCWQSEDDDDGGEESTPNQPTIPFVEFYWANYFRKNLDTFFKQYLEKKGISYKEPICEYQPYSKECMGNEEAFLNIHLRKQGNCVFHLLQSIFLVILVSWI